MTFTFPLIYQARHVCFLVDANKDPGLIEQSFARRLSISGRASRQNVASVTWILDEKS